MAPTQYVDGEEEQLDTIEPFIAEGQRRLAQLYRRPVPAEATELLRWIAREAFRVGHQHAHDRHTVRADPWAEFADEETKK